MTTRSRSRAGSLCQKNTETVQAKETRSQRTASLSAAFLYTLPMSDRNSDSTTPAGRRWLELLPLVQVCRDYPRAWFRSDLLAGITVCVITIPSVIAYAGLAGLAPVHGLY